MDFSLEKYAALLSALKSYGFHSLIIRHDVDLLPENGVRTAKLEVEKGMLGIYYFRAWQICDFLEIFACRSDNCVILLF